MERRELPPSDHISLEDMAAVIEAGPLERQAIVVRLVEAAYERGWADCEAQWTAYADLLETPAARA